MSTEVVHQKNDPFDVGIGRHRHGDTYRHMLNTDPGTPGWLGNPFVLARNVNDAHLMSGMKSVPNREIAVSKFEDAFRSKLQSDEDFREAVLELEGKTLGCWCKPKSCHGDVIVSFLNGDRDRW